MTYLMLAVALMLSAVAAYYSIAGLTAIFAAAVIPIIVMGGTLEVAKLVVASWLYRNWKNVNKLMKAYFVSALVVLMFLTSMGIFGFLSKAHLDQALPSGEIAAQVQTIDQKIAVQKEIINDNRTVLRQLDEAVNQTMGRSTDEQGAARSVSIRKAQTKERAAANRSIEVAQEQVNKLLEQRAPIASQLRQVEAEVGPVKYIASLIYGDTTDQSTLESAVRIVILMIVFVFDPLAVLMLIAVNSDLKRRKHGRNEEETSSQEGKWDRFFQRNWNQGKTEDPVGEETSDQNNSEETSSEETYSRESYKSNRSRNAKRRNKRRVEAISVAKDQELVPVIEWERDRKLTPVNEE